MRAQASFSLSPGETTTDPDGTVHTRHGAATVTLDGNDPRITGTEQSTWNTDQWDNGDDTVALIQWGKTVITTGDGTWTGSFSGAYNDATIDDQITWWLTGHGGYEGLSMFMWTSHTDPNTSGGVYEGLIYPGEPPSGV